MEFDAKKYHTIIFRAPINDLISVSISGRVEYPGTYTLESDATIEDLYKLATLKDDAYTSGIIFTRESVRQRQLDAIADSRKLINEAILINIQRGNDVGDVSLIKNLSESSIEPDYLGRIAGDFSPNNKRAIKTILFSGDSLRIPKNPNVINVLGSVLNPIAFEYDEKLSVRDAISLAGGFQDYADESKIYVIRASGIIEPLPRNIFSRNSIKLSPGDTIVVPRKLIINDRALSFILPFTKILSDLSFSAAALETLSNRN